MIKFLDLKKVNERIRSEMDAAVKRVLDSGWYLLGKECEAFEEEFAAYCGVKHCIGVANGLDAIQEQANNGENSRASNLDTNDYATWNHEPYESLNLEQFEEKWGRNLSRSSIFIISSKTVLADQCSATKVGDEIHVSLELHPITSVLRYVKQMVATSDLDAAPNFHKMHIDMVLDEDLNLLSTKTNEVYDVKSFGITAKNSKGYLQETLIYDVPEELVGLDEACDYVIGG